MIPLAVPNLIGNEQKYLDQCIETTFVSSVGEFVTRLETMAADATGSRFAVAMSAGMAMSLIREPPSMSSPSKQ